MASTSTKVNSIKDVANSGNLNELAEVAQKVQLGNMLTPIKKVLTGLASAAAHNITDAAHGSNPAIATALAVNVTGGAKQGLYVLAPSTATPYDAAATVPGVATLSDDGATITFATAATGFDIVYSARAAVDVATQFDI